MTMTRSVCRDEPDCDHVIQAFAGVAVDVDVLAHEIVASDARARSAAGAAECRRAVFAVFASFPIFLLRIEALAMTR